VAALSRTEINEKLKGMADWSHVGKALHKKYSFKSFMSAIGFVSKIAEAPSRHHHQLQRGEYCTVDTQRGRGHPKRF
jgi:pterin-4a-carbinolamine dehydratase